MSPQCRAVAGSDTGSEILPYRVTWLHFQPLKYFGLLKVLFFKVHESLGSSVYCFRSVILRRSEGFKKRFL